MSERQHIYGDLNESSSARPGGSQQFWLGTEILPRREDFNARHSSIVHLNFYQAPKFCIPA
jgi:hypothetical protein